MTLEEERASYQQSIESIVRATGTRPVGFNAFWLRGTPSTLEILQSLGFIYHIDDVSRDEPFLINVRDKPFAVVPYTLHMNDIVDYETRYFSTAMYADDLKVEFDALCLGRNAASHDVGERARSYRRSPVPREGDRTVHHLPSIPSWRRIQAQR